MLVSHEVFNEEWADTDNLFQFWNLDRMSSVYWHIQVRLYSGSYNKIHVWKACDDFALVHELETQYGAIYSMAVSKKYIITGEPPLLGR